MSWSPRVGLAITLVSIVGCATGSRRGGGTSSSGTDEDAATAVTDIAEPDECVVDAVCAAPEDCQAGQRCNEELAPPRCQVLYCAGVGESCGGLDDLCEVGLVCPSAPPSSACQAPGGDEPDAGGLPPTDVEVEADAEADGDSDVGSDAVGDVSLPDAGAPDVTAPSDVFAPDSAFCQPGYAFCNGNTLFTCDAEGSGYGTETCSDGCVNGVCL